MSVYSYKVGGSLDSNDSTYVVRQADSQLYDGLKAGDFCYVLNSRQMGKSSLRVRTMKRLQAEGIACASIDITVIGSQSPMPESWYGGIAFELLKGFSLLSKVNFILWWRDREVLPPVQRLGQVIEEVLLVELSHNLVIFIDEIDSILKIPFKDDFFAFIRACYNRRVDNSAYKRLTFCLLGVATPADLIDDKARTPFNIGRAIALNGFEIKEAQPLVKGFDGKVDNPTKVLQQVLDWTGGQPFLTQKLCKLVVEKAKSSNPEIERLVRTHIIANWESQDEPEHLRTIRDRLLCNDQRASRLLGLYQQILLDLGELTADGSSEHIEMRLSGLVVKENDLLQVYNNIYKSVFDGNWVDHELTKLRPYSANITAWLASNRQDESRLLREQDLQEALTWKIGKSLSCYDNDFLDASQQLAMREMQSNLEAVEQQAENILTDAEQKANNRLTIAALVSVILVVIMGLWGMKESQELNIMAEKNRNAEQRLTQIIQSQQDTQQRLEEVMQRVALSEKKLNQTQNFLVKNPQGLGAFLDNTINKLSEINDYLSFPLIRGDRGPQVKELQEKLKDSNFYSGLIDGIFSPQTEEAVIRFQKANNISVDGIASPATQEALWKYRPYMVVVEIRSTDTLSQVRRYVPDAFLENSDSGDSEPDVYVNAGEFSKKSKAESRVQLLKSHGINSVLYERYH